MRVTECLIKYRKGELCEPLEDDEYPDLITHGEARELEPGKNKMGWVLYTHFYNAIRSDDSVICAAFDVEKTDKQEINCITIKLPKYSDQSSETEAYDDREYYWELPEMHSPECEDGAFIRFRMPICTSSKSEKVWRFCVDGNNKIEKREQRDFSETNYITTVGISEICCGNIDDEKSRFIPVRTLYLFTNTSPGIDSEQYDRMLYDLMDIYEDAVCKRNTGQSISIIRGDSISKYILNQLNRIDHYLSRIALSPEKELIRRNMKLPLHKVKHFTGRSLADYEAGNTPAISTFEYAESFDIYEHRVIKRFLESLIRTSKRRTKYSPKQNDIGFLASPGNGDDAVIGRDYDTRISRAQTAKTYLTTTRLIKAQIKINHMLSVKITNGELRVSPAVTDSWYFKSSFSYDKEEQNYNTQYGKNITYCVGLNDDFYAALYFLYITTEIQRCSIGEYVTIVGEADKEPEVKPARNNPQYNFSVLIRFQTLECVKKRDGNEDFALSFGEFKEKMLGDADFENEIRHMYIFAHKKESDLLQNCGAKYEAAQREDENAWRLIGKCARDMLNAYEFLRVPDIKGAYDLAKTTNLFVNGNYYRDVFFIIRDISKQFYCVEHENEIRKRVRASQNLYEVWALAAMLEYFSKIGFVSTGETSLVGLLSDYFSSGESEEAGFELVKKLPYNDTIKVKVVYQAKFIRDKNKSEYACGNKLNPDYTWEITYNDDPLTTKYVIIDAKYRDFHSQGKNEWFKVLFQTAFYKYVCWMNEFGDSGVSLKKGNLCSSFIVHPYVGSDVSEELEIGETTTEFQSYGYYGQSIRHFIEKESIKPEDPFFDRLKREIPESEELIAGNSKNAEALKYGRIGTIGLLPGHKDYLMNLFRMIMEHYFRKDGSICWRCGSANVEILPGDGAGTRYRCKDCDEFWVKTICQNDHTHPIRKHGLNYYLSTKQYKWNIICPICGTVYSAKEDSQIIHNFC